MTRRWAFGTIGLAAGFSGLAVVFTILTGVALSIALAALVVIPLVVTIMIARRVPRPIVREVWWVARAGLLAGLNPKLTIFFLAFLPQFVGPGASSPLTQLILLSGVFMAMTFAIFVVYGVLAHAFRRAVIESPQARSWLRRGFAATFAGLAVNLALTER